MKEERDFSVQKALSEIKFTKPTEKAFDAEKMNRIINDEIGQWEELKPKQIDRMNTPFWNELRKKKLGIKD